METINHECYVSLEVAKLLKEAGFDWESHFACEQQQDEWQQSASIEVPNPHYDKSIPFSSPTNIVVLPHITLEVAQRWLREVKECAVIVETHNIQAACVSAYVYCIYPTDATHPCEHINGFAEDQCFDTYEEAQEAGIKNALEIILERGE